MPRESAYQRRGVQACLSAAGMLRLLADLIREWIRAAKSGGLPRRIVGNALQEDAEWLERLAEELKARE